MFFDRVFAFVNPSGNTGQIHVVAVNDGGRVMNRFIDFPLVVGNDAFQVIFREYGVRYDAQDAQRY